ncbi:hypothetical protein [Aquimonas voraii]|uniref:Uncharacterized protein n=1 Tax=Aquimonas voraii TaxID=265719 RepID=A0A1G7A6D9_9GAMM|nr:hypothetical protein [Aquimonas voraii]SDE10243.1 hypothetical protein SAMN04488509_11935 [Aquimonas voraii]
MSEIVLAYLGAYTAPVMALALGLAIALRRSMRKRHLLWLLGVTVLSLLGFFGLLIAGFQLYRGPGPGASLLHLALVLLAGLFVGSSALAGFSFLLKLLGLAPLEDRPADSGR